MNKLFPVSSNASNLSRRNRKLYSLFAKAVFYEKFRILDKTSEALIANFEEVRGFGEGDLAPFRRSGKWGYIDLFGNIVIDAQFDDAGGFSQGLAPARKDNKNFYINRAGQIVFELKEGLSGGVFNEGLRRSFTVRRRSPPLWFYRYKRKHRYKARVQRSLESIRRTIRELF